MKFIDLDSPEFRLSFSSFEGIDTDTMMQTTIPAFPVSCDVCNYQYCAIDTQKPIDQEKLDTAIAAIDPDTLTSFALNELRTGGAAILTTAQVLSILEYAWGITKPYDPTTSFVKKNSTYSFNGSLKRYSYALTFQRTRLGLYKGQIEITYL